MKINLKTGLRSGLRASVLIFLAALFAVSMAGAQPAASSNIGLGFELGNPSGLSLKLPQGPDHAFQFLLAFDDHSGDNWNNRGWSDNCNEATNDCSGRFYLGADYLWYNYNAIPVKQGRLPFYYGPGLWTSLSNSSAVGMRFVLGLEYQFATAPFDIFLEIAPGIRVIPNTSGYVSSGLGARFFF
jgi:hypothetical protein